MPASMWSRALDVFRQNFDDEYFEEPMASEALHEDEGVYQLRPDPTPDSACPLVRAAPRNMDEATCVADEIKRRVPVILNLEDCSPDEARRIRDFVGGVTYGLDGYMKKIGSWVYACAPFDMPVKRLVLDGASFGQPRYETDDDNDDS
jgi:cell division inhibitor SepF